MSLQHNIYTRKTKQTNNWFTERQFLFLFYGFLIGHVQSICNDTDIRIEQLRSCFFFCFYFTPVDVAQCMFLESNHSKFLSSIICRANQFDCTIWLCKNTSANQYFFFGIQKQNSMHSRILFLIQKENINNNKEKTNFTWNYRNRRKTRLWEIE